MVKHFVFFFLLFSAITVMARSWSRVDRVVQDAAEKKAVLQTLTLIDQGGPFPFPRDGIVFANRERRLPMHRRGYYHEYTVPTSGARNRGARRIIRGGGGETYYTRDHYGTFARLDE